MRDLIPLLFVQKPRWLAVTSNVTLITETEMATSLALQVLVYYNILYSTVWTIVTSLIYIYKVTSLHQSPNCTNLNPNPVTLASTPSPPLTLSTDPNWFNMFAVSEG